MSHAREIFLLFFKVEDILSLQDKMPPKGINVRVLSLDTELGKVENFQHEVTICPAPIFHILGGLMCVLLNKKLLFLENS